MCGVDRISHSDAALIFAALQHLCLHLAGLKVLHVGRDISPHAHALSNGGHFVPMQQACSDDHAARCIPECGPELILAANDGIECRDGDDAHDLALLAVIHTQDDGGLWLKVDPLRQSHLPICTAGHALA
eukprot:scaffold98083_cov31-Tisochrysis_lutea.AAC.1